MEPPADRLKAAIQKAAQYCALAERSPKQAKEKLLSYGVSSSEIDQAMAQLINSGFVDVERFARAFANDKFRFNKWGKFRIKLELSRHEIPDYAVQLGLEYLNQEEYESMIVSLIEDKWSKIRSESVSLIRKRKVVDHLVRKGFEPQLVSSLLNDFLSSGEH